MKKFNEYINESRSFNDIKNEFGDIKTDYNSINTVSVFERQLDDLNGIEKYNNLENLFCTNNNIVSLEPIRNLLKIRVILCHHNPIVSLEPLKNLINLYQLYCNHCQIESFKGLPEKNMNLLCSYNPLNNWEEDVDAFVRAYKLSKEEHKRWFEHQNKFNEIIDLIKINMI